MRGPSAVILKENENMLFTDVSTIYGPVNVTYATRWIKKSENVIVPGNLWIEIRGIAPTLKEAINPFANAGLSGIASMAFSANAAIGELEVEVAYDCTAGVEEREYFQSYVPPESEILKSARIINSKETTAFVEAINKNPESERLYRALNQYRLALDSWKLGRSTLVLAHLWMALEALTKAKIRLLQDEHKVSTPDELSNVLDIKITELDPTIRRDYFLQGDIDCYRKAKKSSDGFEHGFIGYDKLRGLSSEVRHKTAQYTRSAIMDVAGLSDVSADILKSAPFDLPLGLWPIAKYLKGKLKGKGDLLALPGNAYPFIKWKSAIVMCKPDEGGNIQTKCTETFSEQLADDITFELESFEVWKPK